MFSRQPLPPDPSRPYSPPPLYFSARRRLQNDKFSTLKKDFRCLRGTFCAALSFRLLFASLVSFLPLTFRPLSSLPRPALSLFHAPSLFPSLLTYLLSFLARSLRPSSLARTSIRRSPLLCFSLRFFPANLQCPRL